ncbi:MAG: hypothetical protein ACRD1F_10665 [Terriglobales bacterium]
MALPGQIIAGGSFGVLADGGQPHAIGRVAGSIGVALPPVPHVLFLWDMASLGYDRQSGHNGGSLGTGLEVWVSPSLRPAQSWGPLLLGEVALGRRFGTGLHGYTALGAGLGWSLGDWVPYVEYRYRTSFHAHRPVDRQIVVGVKFVLFG